MKCCVLTAATRVQDDSGNAAVAFAATALRRDLQRKFGPLHGRDPAPAAPRIELRLCEDGGFDTHSVAVRPEHIVIAGSDELGLIHGIYRFSEKWLGADPCHFFTGALPALAERVEIPCGTTTSRPYSFRHRGFFFNDEDLLVGFQLEKPEHGFSLDVWRNLFELALRMQCTCVIPGTNILPDEPQIKLASDMGLFIAQHHAEPLGSAPFYWPRGVPFSWSTNRAEILSYWRKAITRQAGRKVLWTLNFRGLVDRPFWVDDPNMSPDAPLAQKAQIINEVLAAQYELIREVRGEEQPETYGYLWGELFDLYQAGLLRYPAATSVIHTDDGDACMRSNLEDLVARSPNPTGVYQHISMFNGTQSMRVTSFAPAVYARELRRAMDLGMTRIFILNVGNVREKIFNLRQVMGYANDYATMAGIAGPDGDGYFAWYLREVLGAEHPELAEPYRALTEIPFALNDKRPDNRVGDNFYTIFVRFVLQRVYNREDLPPALWALRPFANLRESLLWCRDALDATEPRWSLAAERARDAARHLQGHRRSFFEQDAVAQVEKVLHLTRMVQAFCRSVLAYQDRRGYEAYLDAFQALRHCEAALAVEQRLDTGAFKGWHRNDLNCRTWKCRDFLTTWHAMLNDARWLNLEGLAEGPQPCYAAYKYNPNFPTAYRKELFLQPER